MTKDITANNHIFAAIPNKSRTRCLAMPGQTETHFQEGQLGARGLQTHQYRKLTVAGTAPTTCLLPSSFTPPQ